MQNPVSISIGIPAYNEEANIKQLLAAILNQREISFKLDAVIVVSDGSEDHTVGEVQSVQDARVHLIINQSRKGQSCAQNTIFNVVKSDIVVVFEADTIPNDTEYLERLIRPIINNARIGFVQGNAVPLPAETLFGRIFRAQIAIYQDLSIKDSEALSLSVSGRGGRAFTRYVYQKMRWPIAVPEDSYALLWCRDNSISAVFQESAICFFRCAETFTDFLKVRKKTNGGRMALERYFKEDNVRRIYNTPVWLRLQMLMRFFLRHPFYAISYLWITATLTLMQDNQLFNDFLETAPSTKRLLTSSDSIAE